MTRKLFVFGGIAVGIAGVAAAVWLRSGPDPAEFFYLRAPHVTHLPPQRMLVVEATGDPNAVSAGGATVPLSKTRGFDRGTA